MPGLNLKAHHPPNYDCIIVSQGPRYVLLIIMVFYYSWNSSNRKSLFHCKVVGYCGTAVVQPSMMPHIWAMPGILNDRG